MSNQVTKPQTEKLELEYDLDAEPEKVWRAIYLDEYREKWLPNDALAKQDAVSTIPGQEVRYRMRDEEPPFLESEVTFRITPNPAGGTHLKVVHELVDRRLDMKLTAANNNSPHMMLAA